MLRDILLILKHVGLVERITPRNTELQKSNVEHFLNHQRFLLRRHCVKWSVKWVHLTFLHWIMRIIGTSRICHQFTLTCAHATACQAGSQKSDPLDKPHTLASLASFAEARLKWSSNLTSHFGLPFIWCYIRHLKDACQTQRMECSLSCFEGIMGKQIHWSNKKNKKNKSKHRHLYAADCNPACNFRGCLKVCRAFSS